MSARDDILAAIRTARRAPAVRPAPFVPPQRDDDPVQRFATAAQKAAAEVRLLDGADEIAGAVADILRARNMAPVVHRPPEADSDAITGIEIRNTLPGPEDAALTRVPFAIAETGTLAYPAAANAPASWHFRPGLEIAIVQAADILPNMEAVLARVKAAGLPSTLNFVTGPSRTADIEQTIELGAHGPKGLVVLVVKV